jgi:hypothetical protein
VYFIQVSKEDVLIKTCHLERNTADTGRNRKQDGTGVQEIRSSCLVPGDI